VNLDRLTACATERRALILWNFHRNVNPVAARGPQGATAMENYRRKEAEALDPLGDWARK
jgi:hypothetical protein